MRKLCYVTKTLMFVLGVTMIGASQQPPARQIIVLQQDDSPAGPGSAEPNLYTSGDGGVYLSWIEPAGENRHALRFAVRTGSKWSEPRMIAEGRTSWSTGPIFLL
jgi:hypothetical protein